MIGRHAPKRGNYDFFTKDHGDFPGNSLSLPGKTLAQVMRGESPKNVALENKGLPTRNSVRCSGFATASPIWNTFGMPTRPGGSPLSPLYPIRVFVLVLLSVFLIECTIMIWWLPRLPPAWRGRLAESLIDSIILTFVTAPAVWFLAVLPLRQLFEVRGRLLRRLFETQEQERAHIARDLHDGVGQHLTAMMVGLRLIQEAEDLESARAHAAQFHQLGLQAHEEVRMLARGLRPTLLEDLGLQPALLRMCEDFQRIHDIRVSLRCQPSTLQRLNREIETALYRIVQEALTNIVRHADARTAELELVQTADIMSLTIHDDGRGFSQEHAGSLRRKDGGFGLGSMHERASLLNGDFQIIALPGQGTTIRVHIPMKT